MNRLLITNATVLLLSQSLIADDYLRLISSDRIEQVEQIWKPHGLFPSTLTDIASRLPEDTKAKEADLITYAHEGSHFLSRYKPHQHGIYILGGKRIYLDIPDLPIKELFIHIPDADRGIIYDTYKRQSESQYWADRPTMVLDEWIAYTHGSMVRKELALEGRSETDRFCAIMATYCWHLIRLLDDKGKNTRELKQFCRWNEKRCSITINHWDRLFTKDFD